MSLQVEKLLSRAVRANKNALWADDVKAESFV